MSDPGGVAADQLRAFVERIERLEEEKKVISDDIKDVYAEAKGNGYDVKILRKVVSLRKKQPHEREEEEAVLDLYMHALGMAGPPVRKAEPPARSLTDMQKERPLAALFLSGSVCRSCRFVREGSSGRNGPAERSRPAHRQTGRCAGRHRACGQSLPPRSGCPVSSRFSARAGWDG